MARQPGLPPRWNEGRVLLLLLLLLLLTIITMTIQQRHSRHPLHYQLKSNLKPVFYSAGLHDRVGFACQRRRRQCRSRRHQRRKRPQPATSAALLRCRSFLLNHPCCMRQHVCHGHRLLQIQLCQRVHPLFSKAFCALNSSLQIQPHSEMHSCSHDPHLVRRALCSSWHVTRRPVFAFQCLMQACRNRDRSCCHATSQRGGSFCGLQFAGQVRCVHGGGV